MQPPTSADRELERLGADDLPPAWLGGPPQVAGTERSSPGILLPASCSNTAPVAPAAPTALGVTVSGHVGELQRPVLPKLFIWSNWPSPPTELPTFLVRNAGHRLEELRDRLRSEVSGDPRLTIGRVWALEESQHILGNLRVLQRIKPGHTVATDVIFQRQGDDLFVSVRQSVSTLAAVLRSGVLSVAAAIVLASLAWFAVTNTGLRSAWVSDFAAKYAPTISFGKFSDGSPELPVDTQAMLAHYINNGDLVHAASVIAGNGFNLRVLAHVRDDERPRLSEVERALSRQQEALTRDMGSRLFDDQFWQQVAMVQVARKVFSETIHRNISAMRDKCPAIDAEVSQAELLAENESLPAKLEAISAYTAEPWSSWQLFKADPKLFFTGVGAIPALLGLAGWVGVIFAPRAWIHYFCLLLSWPTPENLASTVQSHSGAVVKALGEVQTKMGISKEDLIPLAK